MTSTFVVVAGDLEQFWRVGKPPSSFDQHILGSVFCFVTNIFCISDIFTHLLPTQKKQLANPQLLQPPRTCQTGGVVLSQGYLHIFFRSEQARSGGGDVSGTCEGRRVKVFLC